VSRKTRNHPAPVLALVGNDPELIDVEDHKAEETKAEETKAEETKAEETEAEETEAEETATPDKLGPKTVVKTKYKHTYQDRARALGRTDKASKRGNGDWLQRELQAETMSGDRFDVARFIEIMDANGVDYSRWNTTTRGWEGRFRMSGSIVLRGRVGKSGVLQLPNGPVDVQAIADEGDEDARAFLAKWSN
jgi:hypothetical protein